MFNETDTIAVITETNVQLRKERTQIYSYLPSTTYFVPILSLERARISSSLSLRNVDTNISNENYTNRLIIEDKVGRQSLCLLFTVFCLMITH